MMRFAVIGLDHFGYNLATALSRQHEVLVIDNDEQKIEKIKDSVNLAVTADTRDKEVLSKLVDRNVNAAIVSLGEDVTSSILAVLHLLSIGVKNVIAKAVSEQHGKILKLVGAKEVVFPEKDIANGIAIKLTTRNLVEQIPLADDYSIVEIAVPDNFAGRTLGELDLRNKYDVVVIAIKDVLRDKFFLIPKADFRINADTALIVIGKSSSIEKLKF